jgi:magnesium chelatase subunit I
VVRIGDVYAALPAITGKMELEYEGELQGGEAIARDLIAAAARDVFDGFFDAEDLDDTVNYFDEGGVLQVSDTSAAEAAWKGFEALPGLREALEDSELYESDDAGLTLAAAELVLEGLAAHRRISRSESGAFGRARPRRRPGGEGGMAFG